MNRNSYIRDDGIIRVGQEFQTPNGFLTGMNYGAILGASATNVLNAHAADGTTVKPLVQPDVPRTLQVKASGAATAAVVVHGKRKGVAISESFTLNGTSEVPGAHAFDEIDSIVLPTGAYTVSVGFADIYGLDREPFAADASIILAATVDGVLDTITAITSDNSDDSLNTVTFTTAANASKKFRLMYLSANLLS